MNMTIVTESETSWYEATSAIPARPSLGIDLDVDVCVIGGGLAGLTTAREVARRGWSACVLEARKLAWNASGRNCGVVMPGYSAALAGIVERVGLARAKALWTLSERGVDYIRDTIADAGIIDAAPVDGWLDISKVDDGDAFMAVLALLGQEFGASVEGWPVERVRAHLKTDHYFHAIHYPTAFHIDPLTYARGLAQDAEAAGARIFEQTPAMEIDPAGVRKRITTPGGRVRAAHVVLAGNAHLGTLVPRLAETVMPVANYVAVSAPLGERLADAVAYRGAVSDTADLHYRIVGGDRLMWSGGAGLWPRDPRAVAKGFGKAIARLYPQLGEVAFSHAWSGTMGLALHRMPQIGEISPGIWLASAFGSRGLATTAMAGELIAGAIIDGDDRWRLFLPYELVWTGGRLGRVVAQAHSWGGQARDKVVAGAARRREAVRQGQD